MKCLVIDDEELARALMGNYISRLPDLEVVAYCKNPIEALEILGKHQIDLLFLDIQMPELTGLEFLETLREKPIVIFTTAYSEHALNAYNLNVLDYLLKPFSFQRFIQAVSKAREKYYLEIMAREKQNPRLELTPQKEIPDYLLVHANHKVHKIKLNSILYVQSMREYVAYYLENSPRLLSLNSLKKLEQKLPQDRFTRIHKSYLVSNKFVDTLEGNRLYLGEIALPIGGSYKEDVIRRLFS